ncbi:hypothetical protein [Vulcanisaeta sp. JCM 14467]|uniref:hypothetical protein n=1 Tax=Vulcanisaeta sp. JCM 14467 TaxID=1295370 RepID=UPI0006D26589|nr:hypothetical protein [Vulcanisaeta sp. JCM 14467]
MSEWTWANNKLNQPIHNYSLVILIISIPLAIYIITIFLAYLTYQSGDLSSYRFIAFLILASFLIAILLATIIYAYLRIRFIKRVAAFLRRVEIKEKSIILDTADGTYTTKLNEINICYRARMWGVNPIAYNIFIRYQDLIYEIPELRPEDFGALRQVLRGYGVELNECADDLSKYVYMGRPQRQW